MRLHRQATTLAVTAIVLAGCQSMYYAGMEKMGWHKRDLMVSRVKAARDAQEDAKEQFRDALERFGEVVAYDGGSLEARYDALRRELERSEARAQDVRERIEAVEDVSEALFYEWERELDEYSDAGLRRASERKLAATQRQYERLIGAMWRAESRIEPVLRPLRDQVLFLKHNLNARAVASLEGELVTVEADVEALVRAMEDAIAEADAFIAEIES